ncbi:MAG: SPFH domain-containing protein [Lachnospiraceae bacterium]|nr:SPFH domain-containing protein [Lachnospiraceae bacterium]
MGLIQVAKEAIGSVIADQYAEYFYCDSLSDEILMVKGQKSTKNQNKGNDQIISDGSIIAVNEGQAMIIVDQGGIVEFCATPGAFKYDASSEPSIFNGLFTGNLGNSVVNSFKAMWTRGTGGGDLMRDQRVYFFNIKEIKGNLYGTSNPIPFRIFDKNTGFDMDTVLRCNGEYSYKLVDPLLFYKNVSGNKKEEFRRSELTSMMKAELITALQPSLAKISEMGVRPSGIPGHVDDLVNFLNVELSEKWTNLRGIQVVSMTMNPPSIPEEDRATLNELQKTKVFTDPSMAGAQLATAQAEALKLAAANEGTGAMMGLMGMNAANMMGGMNTAQLFQMGQQNAQQGMGQQMMGQQPQMGMQPQQNPQMQPMGAAVLGWTCGCGHADNRSKFCSECGAKKPDDAGWTCTCGAVNQGKFCPECGSKKPEGAPLYKCDQCGWEPEDPANPPKFCPECGDKFDENDIQ